MVEGVVGAGYRECELRRRSLLSVSVLGSACCSLLKDIQLRGW